jgi:hypothetical protein
MASNQLAAQLYLQMAAGQGGVLTDHRLQAALNRRTPEQQDRLLAKLETISARVGELERERREAQERAKRGSKKITR